MNVKTLPLKNETLLYRANCTGALAKAIQTTSAILSEGPEEINSDEIHRGKSVLYAAIEQMGIEISRFQTFQRMLRELLVIVNTSVDCRDLDRQIGFQILFELLERCNLSENKPEEKQAVSA